MENIPELKNLCDKISKEYKKKKQDDNSTLKDFIYYSHDFRFWYHQNKEAIERDIKIDEVCKKEDSYTNKN